jgi:hypothetical protein
MGDINLYAKLMKMRVELQKCDIKKTGYNDFKKFKYYELSDFLPECTKIAADNNLLFLYQLEKEEAVLSMIDCENPDNRILFHFPLAEVDIQGANKMQNIGGLTTYTRRYLYMIAFEISENDEFEPNENNTTDQKKQDKPTAEQQKQINEIAKQKIDQAKIHTIQKELLRTGVTADAICERYKVAELSDITEELFGRVMKALIGTPSLAKGDK